MQIFLDTIDLKVISEAEKRGIIAGITTNPSILSKSSNVRETLHNLLQLQKGPVAVQVTSQDPEEMVREGEEIYKFSSRTIVKVPVTSDGLIAIKQLRKEKIPTLGTAVLTATQALLASNAEVNYISPYFSHLDSPFEQINSIAQLLQNTHSKTKLLVASLREVDQLIFCAEIGVEAVTIKEELFFKLLDDNDAVSGFIEKFSSSWRHSFGDSSICDLLSQETYSYS